ncbi:MAG: Uma2 family endonuclease [Bacteroidia bacterium]|nr:Uma2 family endonuclease [Bacteroidia bacterium]
MAVQLQRRLLNVAEYHAMMKAGILTGDDRLELLEGDLVLLSPIGSQHAAMVRRLEELLHHLLQGKAMVSTQNPIAIPHFSEPEPDIALLKPRADYYAENHPLPADVFLVIEVADSSLEKDREVKLPIYAAAGIPAYWIVNLSDQQIEVFESPANGVYKAHTIATIRDLVELPSLGIEIAVNKVIAAPFRAT